MEPTVIQLLKHLRNSPRGLRGEEIATTVKAEEEYLKKALETLVRIGIVTMKDGVYCYEPASDREDLLPKLVQIYDNVNQKLKVRLIFQGLLLLGGHGYFLRYKTLRRMMAEERYATAEEMNALLAQEIKDGYVDRLRICFGDKWRIQTPLSLPWSAISVSPFIPSEYEDFREGWKKAGFLVQEEDYLRGKYPSEVARRAAAYLEKEGVKLKDRVLAGIASEVYDNWMKTRWFFQLTQVPQSYNSKFPVVLAVQLPPQV